MKQRPTPARPGHLRTACTLSLLALMLGASASAHAQWAWKDAQGRITYSDSPPPPDVRADAILHHPEASAATDSNGRPSEGDGAAQAAPKPAAAGPAAGAPKSLAEQDADFRKRRDERLKAEQKEAEEQSKAAKRQADCAQARGYLDMLQSGMRVMRPNPDGTRGYMGDDARAEETQKAQDSVAQNCS